MTSDHASGVDTGAPGRGRAAKRPDQRLAEAVLQEVDVHLAGTPADQWDITCGGNGVRGPDGCSGDVIEEFLTGQRPAVSDTDRVLATVLFTDIVDSTARAVELGDRRWRELLQKHDVLVRRQLERYRGCEVDTAGDGFLAAFDGPGRAVRCTASIREAVGGLGLAIRAGLHTGECELIGNRVAGIAVHLGARILTLASPGEVLVSATVKHLVAGSGLRFADRGVHVLKGVPGEWHLFAAEL